MAKTKKNHLNEYDDDDSNYTRHKKNPKHSANLKGRGMRVINSFVEEDFDEYSDYLDDDEDDEESSTDNTINTR